MSYFEEYISFDNHKELLNPFVKVKDIKKIIKEITGSDEENQQIDILLQLQHSYDESFFWDFAKIKVVDKTRYRMKLTRSLYETYIILDLNKKIEDLKNFINEHTKIPIEKLQFKLNDCILDNNETLINRNLSSDKLSVNIIKKLNNQIRLKYPNSEEKQINTDLCNTGIELLEEIQGNCIKSPNDIKYNLVYKNENLYLGYLLVSSGIKDGDLIELKEWNNTFPIFVITLVNKIIPVNVKSSDTVYNLKELIYQFGEIDPEEQRLIFKGKQLEDHKTMADYEVEKGSTLHVVLRLRGGNN
jgi:ubiquitin C